MKAYLLVALGGMVGTMLRFSVNLYLPAQTLFPWASFTVNMIGSFLIGVGAAVFLFLTKADYEAWRLFLLIGLLGGFTTFSTYSLDTLRLLQEAEYGLALLYAGGSVLTGLALAAFGFYIIRALL